MTITAQDVEIVGYWNQRKAWAQELKNNHESDWLRFWRWYRAYSEELNDPLDWWRSNEVVPQAFKIIETLLPRHIMSMFSSAEPFQAVGRETNDEMYEKTVQALLLYGIDIMELFPKAFEGLKYCLIMGHLYNKVYWKTAYNKRIRDYLDVQRDGKTGQLTARIKQSVRDELSYNDPMYEWIRLDKGWPDPTGKARWFIEEVDTTLEDLYSRQKKYGIYRNLDYVEWQMSKKYSNKEVLEPSVETESISEDTVALRRDVKDYVKLYQCWGWVPKEFASDEIQMRVQVIADDTVLIRDDVMPTPDYDLPIWNTKSIPIPNRLFGESILKYIGPQIDQMNRIENWRMDEVLLNIWQQYKIGRGAGITSNQMLFQPGGALWCDDITQVELLQRRPVLPEAYQESEKKRIETEHASAATDIVQGVSQTDRATATEVERRLQQGNVRFQLNSMWLDYTWKKPLLERMFKLYQRYLPPDRVVRIIGKQGVQQVPVDITQIQMPVDIKIEAGIFAFNKEVRKDYLVQMMQAAGQPPFAQWWRVQELLREWIELLGFKNPEKYIKTPDEVANEMAQMAQQQMAEDQERPKQKIVERSKVGGNGEGSSREFERTVEVEGVPM